MKKKYQIHFLIILVFVTLTGCKKIVDPDETNESSCLDRAVFGNPADSDYILPFAVGKSFQCGQNYCYQNGGHRNQLSYDFQMEIGDEVLASRGGLVMAIKEDSPDNGQGAGEHNVIYIQHDDGTIACYAHIQQNCVIVMEGDSVQTGDLIAYSGNSGLTNGPHLHFMVYRRWPTREGDDVPVNFRNSEGPLDNRGGLIMFESYLALPF